MELRKDPITRSWILVGDEEPAEQPSAHCPYCSPSPPGERPIFTLSSDGHGADGGTRVYPHPHPLYRIEGDAQRSAVGIYDRMRTIGAHELIIESPAHDVSLWTADEASVESVLLTYAHRIEDLKRDVRFRYVCVFKNCGAAAGQEISHTHSELTATTFIPRRLIYELRACQEYYQLKERCVFCDILQQEERSNSRVVEVTPNYLALCPFAPRVPFEFWVLPRSHESSYERGALRSGSVRELAGLLRRCLARLLNLVECFHMVVHTTPNTRAGIYSPGKWSTLEEDYHWHFEVMPISQRVRKSYSIKEVYFCPLSPESAAERLRQAPTTAPATVGALRESSASP